jgi:hypothetical protein
MTTYSERDAYRLDRIIGELTPTEMRNELRYQARLKESRHVPVAFSSLFDRAMSAKQAYRSKRSLGAINRRDRRP